MALDLNRLREKYQQKAQSSVSFDKWEPKEGENNIRILPHSTAYFNGSVDEFVYTYLIHYNVGSDKKVAICPKGANSNAKCPICEASTGFYRSANDKDKELASDLYHRKRFLTNIIDLDNIAKGIQIYELGPTVYHKLMKYIASGLFGDILDLENGRNIILSKTVPGGNIRMTNYELMVSPEKSSIANLLSPDYLQKIDELGKVLPKAKPYEELKVILEGEDGSAVATSSEVTAAPHPIQDTQPKVEPKAEKMVCFGTEYSIKSSKCRVCGEFEPCKVQFIRLISEG